MKILATVEFEAPPNLSHDEVREFIEDAIWVAIALRTPHHKIKEIDRKSIKVDTVLRELTYKDWTGREQE